MAFDGTWYGLIPLISPNEYHPGGSPVAGVVSKTLAGANSYCRHTAGRRIGDQTYRIFARDGGSFSAYGGVANTTWEVIAEFYTKYIPAHATHIRSRASVAVKGQQGVVHAYGRTVVTDTGGTDTGSSVVQQVNLSNHTLLDWTSQITEGQTVSTFESEVALSNINQAEVATVSVQAYVADIADSTAMFFQPLYVVAWWDCQG